METRPPYEFSAFLTSSYKRSLVRIREQLVALQKRCFKTSSPTSSSFLPSHRNDGFEALPIKHAVWLVFLASPLKLSISPLLQLGKDHVDVFHGYLLTTRQSRRAVTLL